MDTQSTREKVPKTPHAPPQTPEQVVAALRSQIAAAQAQARQSVNASITAVRQSIDASRAILGSGEVFFEKTLLHTEKYLDLGQKRVEDAFRRAQTAVGQTLQMVQSAGIPAPTAPGKTEKAESKTS